MSNRTIADAIDLELQRREIVVSGHQTAAVALRYGAGLELAVPCPGLVDGVEVVITATLDRTATIRHQDDHMAVVGLDQVTLLEPPRWSKVRRHSFVSDAQVLGSERGRAAALVSRGRG